MRTTLLRCLLLLAVAALPSPLRSQAPSADWRTLTTAHFRLHYPAGSEAWAERAAARIESIRERVIAEVGYAPPEVVDVLISDPVADSNGEAIPLIGGPRLILWTNPPGPESELGHYSDWSDLLITHEETHLVHLLRPSRDPVLQLLTVLAPIGPIPINAPRWVTEGYATVVEGRLTASGRPNGDLRAATLRRWAQTGKLPSYARLAADHSSWQGMSMAYLLGSAYLEWLDERTGPGSLRKLWVRMTAKNGRGFGEAFRGVFGDSPENLYDRFRAELTYRAIEVEHRVQGTTAAAKQGMEGELWQELTRTTGHPTVSPDGKLLAIVLRARNRPAKLVVWSTGANEKAERKWEKERAKLAREDPDDVPEVRGAPLPREPLYTLPTFDPVAPTTPCFLPDGKSILFVRYEPDGEGFLHPDLFRWTLAGGRVERLTRQADLRDPDASPDGRSAVAVRNRDGRSQVVRVDLATAEVKPLTEASLDIVYDRPRVSPDGRRVVFARHREGSWRLVIRPLDGPDEIELAPPTPDGTVSSPAWSRDGQTLYGVVGERGFIDLYAFPLASGAKPVALTRAPGAALAPTPIPDGSALFYLQLEPHGLDLRRLDLRRTAPAAPSAESAALDLPATLAPAIRPPAPAPQPPYAQAAVAPGQPYGLGRQELGSFLSAAGSSAGSTVELGVRGGDVLGRLDYLAFGALSRDGWPEGGALAVAYRGWPVDLGLHLFSARERPSEEAGKVPDRGDLLDLDRRGAELRGSWNRQWSGGRLDVAASGLWSRIDPTGSAAVSEEILGLRGRYAARRAWNLWRIEPSLGGHYEAGSTGGGSWSRYGGAASLGLGYGDSRLGLSWRRDGSHDVAHPFDLYQLGGSPSTLLPETVDSGRLAVPALPSGTLLGAEHEEARAELQLGFLPFPLFYERHRLWAEGAPAGDWLSLAGLEWKFSLTPTPIARAAALDLRVGVARVLDRPLEDRTRWWLITVWRP